MVTLSERLNEVKNSKNLLQKQIAEGSGIPLRTYQRYERGEREPSVSSLIAISNFLDTSVDYLIGLSDNPQIVR